MQAFIDKSLTSIEKSNLLNIINSIDKDVFEETKSVATPKANASAKPLRNGGDAPLIIIKAKGSKLTDANKNEYIDFHLSGGAHILGHAPLAVLDSVEDALWNGTSFGMPTPAETLLAKSIGEVISSIDQVRFVNSGTEAVISAIRLARAFTKKNKIIRFDNFYLDELPQHAIQLPYNNQEAVFETFAKYKDDIAAVIVEPVQTNRGVILPADGFLQFLRQTTTEYHSLLIFDEITTGFRPKLGGAQGYFSIQPDLTVLGKILGGGFSLGAYGGRKDIMSAIIVEDAEFQPAISRANPIAITAGLAIMKKLKTMLFYETLNHKSRDFIFWLKEITASKGITINSFQSMFSIYFLETDVRNFNDAKNSDIKRFERFHKKVIEKGIFPSPSPFGTNFISAAHSPEDLNRALEVVNLALKTV